MNIVKPYAKILPLPFKAVFEQSSGIELLQLVESYGRVSHRSEDKQNENSWDRFIRTVVLQHGDWSITEHCSITVEALVDRGITHEWVRHRIGAYTQESTRFVNYSKGIPASFIYPCTMGHVVESDNQDWMRSIEQAEESYQNMIKSGIPPQIARSVFPNALASKLIVTYNLRNWRHFFLMRTSKEAHPQMKEVTIPLLEEFQAKIPILYEDIIPMSRQIDNLKMGR